MKIVILDSYTTDQGRGGWHALDRLGELTVYDRTEPDQVLERCEDASVVITNKVPFDAATMEALPELRYIGLLATGTNVIDLEAARSLDIAVTNVPSYSAASVAQMVFAHVLHHSTAVAAHSTAVGDGAWASSKDFSLTLQPLSELAGKHIGIIGHGEIGRHVEQIAKGFGMYTLIGRLPHRPQRPGLVELDEMLEEADVVSLHCPLAKETHKMVDRSFLARMKPTAILVNTGRGGLIDEAALAAHLSEHPEFRAGLDVLTAEPPPADHPLTGHPQVSITPHVAWATDEARHRLRDSAAMNVESWLHGRPMNRVE